MNSGIDLNSILDIFCISFICAISLRKSEIFHILIFSLQNKKQITGDPSNL